MAVGGGIFIVTVALDFVTQEWKAEGLTSTTNPDVAAAGTLGLQILAVEDNLGNRELFSRDAQSPGAQGRIRRKWTDRVGPLRPADP